MTKKARVSLVYPSDGICYSFKGDDKKRTRRMPLGIAYIGAALENEGHDVRVTDAALDDLTTEETVRRALANDPEFLGIGCTTPLYHQAVDIINEVKRLSPRTTVVFGGPHASALPKATLDTSKADFISIGEGEEAMVEIVKGTRPQDIPSIWFRDDSGFGATAEYRLRLNQPKNTTVKAIDLNKSPIPARHLFDYDRYVDFARFQPGAQAAAMFSRGCPGKCVFCNAADTLVRFRHTDNVMEEMRQIKDMGFESLFVMDDTYTSNKERVKDLSRRIIENDFGLSISVQLRLDQLLDDEIIDLLYESGVRYVGPGIETGNEDMMKWIGKGPRENKKFITQQVNRLKKYDWRIRCSYILGLLDETEEGVWETIEFAKSLGAGENAFTILTPYPGSPLWDIAKAKGQVDDYMDFSKFLYYDKIGCNLSKIPTERLMELHKLAYEHVDSGLDISGRMSANISSGDRPFMPVDQLRAQEGANPTGRITYDDADWKRDLKVQK